MSCPHLSRTWWNLVPEPELPGFSPSALASTAAAPLTGDGGNSLASPFKEKCTSETCFQKMLLKGFISNKRKIIK